MGKKFLDSIRKVFSNIDRNIFTYTIFIVIAALLWFMNELNKDYNDEITYPVRYVQMPKDRYLFSELPQHLTLEVRARGFALLGHKIRTSFMPITFNLSNYTNSLRKNGDVYEYNITQSEMRDKLSGQLNSEINLLGIYPDQIQLRFSEGRTKMIPVIPHVDYTAKRGYILQDTFVCTPDSILVSDPISLIDTLSSLHTVQWKAGDISKTTTSTVELIKPEGLNFEYSAVKITIPIERITEGQKSIPVTVNNLPSNMRIRLFPPNIEVTYDVGLSKYNTVTEDHFQAVADYREVEGSSYLSVSIRQAPSYVKNIRYSPQKVEYILERK